MIEVQVIFFCASAGDCNEPEEGGQEASRREGSGVGVGRGRSGGGDDGEGGNGEGETGMGKWGGVEVLARAGSGEG